MAASNRKALKGRRRSPKGPPGDRPLSGHVLVHGASGTRKELVARAVHAISSRSTGPIVCRNAATFPEALIDAELFGNARNYPNAGMPERRGLVGEADGGTLFLDEFAELPPAMQAHLLRVLDAGEYQRLGEPRARTSSFRLVAATNRPLAAMKEDVLARLVHRIEIPGLDARMEDVPLIARHLFARMAAGNARAVAGDDRRGGRALPGTDSSVPRREQPRQRGHTAGAGPAEPTRADAPREEVRARDTAEDATLGR